MSQANCSDLLHMTSHSVWLLISSERECERAQESVRRPKAFWEASAEHRGCWPSARGSDSSIFRRTSVYAAQRHMKHKHRLWINAPLDLLFVARRSSLDGSINPRSDPPGANWPLHRLGLRHAGIAVRVSGKNQGEHDIHWTLILTGCIRWETDKSAPNGPEIRAAPRTNLQITIGTNESMHWW